jgi:thiamine pyrophosphokinase
VDGGANRLYNLQDAPGFDKIVPNFIIGDLDSIKDDTKNFY